MLEVVKYTLLLFSALFPIVNPLGGSPIFLAQTREYTAGERWLLSQRIAMNSFVLLVVSCLIGTHILAFFGISLPIVQVGGGLIVVATGWAMLSRSDDDDRGDQVHHNADPRDIYKNAFYPFTLPLTVGPGSISVAITLGANGAKLPGINFPVIFSVLTASALIGLTVFVCYGFADRLARLLGATAMSVIMRLSSFLLVCIGVQILWNGVHELLLSAGIAH